MAINWKIIKLCKFGKGTFFLGRRFFLRTIFPDVLLILPLIKGDFFLAERFLFPCGFFSPWTFCPAGHSVARRFVPPDVLYPRTSCPSGCFFPWTFCCRMFGHQTVCHRTLCLGTCEDAGEAYAGPVQQVVCP